MREMARRLPILVVAFIALVSGFAIDVAQADIGFSQAIATGQLFNPGRTLVSLGRRTTNTGLEYNTGFIDSQCTLMYGVSVNGANGFVTAVETEALIYPENLTAQDILGLLPQRTVSFEQALALLRTTTGRPDSLIDRIDLDSELFMLLYVAQYTDGLQYIINAITGEIVQAVDLATPANSISPATYWSRVEHAYALSGAGADWYPIFGATGTTAFGIPVGITLLNPATGRLKQVDMLGTQHQAVDFMPIGHLLLVTSGMRGVVANTAISTGQFLAIIQQTFPGGKMAEFGLQVQSNNGGLSVFWNATVLTSGGISVAFSINAMTPGGSTSNSPHPDRPGDYNCDGHVSGDDLAELLQRYNSQNCDQDIDQDGWVKGEDLAILLCNWG